MEIRNRAPSTWTQGHQRGQTGVLVSFPHFESTLKPSSCCCARLETSSRRCEKIVLHLIFKLYTGLCLQLPQSDKMESKISDLRGEEMTMDSVSLAAGFLLALLASLCTEIRSLIGKKELFQPGRCLESFWNSRRTVLVLFHTGFERSRREHCCQVGGWCQYLS